MSCVLRVTISGRKLQKHRGWGFAPILKIFKGKIRIWQPQTVQLSYTSPKGEVHNKCAYGYIITLTMPVFSAITTNLQQTAHNDWYHVYIGWLTHNNTLVAALLELDARKNTTKPCHFIIAFCAATQYTICPTKIEHIYTMLNRHTNTVCWQNGGLDASTQNCQMHLQLRVQRKTVGKVYVMATVLFLHN